MHEVSERMYISRTLGIASQPKTRLTRASSRVYGIRTANAEGSWEESTHLSAGGRGGGLEEADILSYGARDTRLACPMIDYVAWMRADWSLGGTRYSVESNLPRADMKGLKETPPALSCFGLPTPLY